MTTARRRRARRCKAARSFFSEALRPADSTDLWQSARETLERRAHAAKRWPSVAIIEAADEIEEALALAIAMREALETPGKTAALISPDLQIARRVKAELARWGVEVEDSAGEKLGQTAAGAFARLVLNAAFDGRAARSSGAARRIRSRCCRARAAKSRRRRARWSSAPCAESCRPSGLDDVAAAVRGRAKSGERRSCP